MPISFTPRLDASGMEGSVYYYSGNPYHTSGYGLPNCTCYAWGRHYEILGYKPAWLSMGNAKEWYPHAQSNRPDLCGSKPKLGAILCTYYAVGGHVAVVEKINTDGSILVSQSGYSSQIYFWTETLFPPYKASWASSTAYVQGFIYLPEDVIDPTKVSLVRWIPG